MIEIWSWLLEPRGLFTLACIGLLLVFSWLAAASQNLRRGRAMLAILNDSTRGVVALQRGPNFQGFFTKITPAPEPFIQFIITYHAASNLNVVGLLLRPLTRYADRMVIHGKLIARPGAELIWQRGRVPSRALGHDRGAMLWVQRRLDFVDAEYATRGVNPGALIHGFADLYTRFGPWLYKFSVQADDVPEMEIVLTTHGLNPDELAALVTTLRAAGRAAMLR
ncbi:MAG: hypothetical protein NT075_00360 [Chloroflexi bacterium]|nr:hypothetical protein [Chloroflexota bacterium]